jgi:hypothetical protein
MKRFVIWFIVVLAAGGAARSTRADPPPPNKADPCDKIDASLPRAKQQECAEKRKKKQAEANEQRLAEEAAKQAANKRCNDFNSEAQNALLDLSNLRAVDPFYGDLAQHDAALAKARATLSAYPKARGAACGYHYTDNTVPGVSRGVDVADEAACLAIEACRTQQRGPDPGAAEGIERYAAHIANERACRADATCSVWRRTLHLQRDEDDICQLEGVLKGEREKAAKYASEPATAPYVQQQEKEVQKEEEALKTATHRFQQQYGQSPSSGCGAQSAPKSVPPAEMNHEGECLGAHRSECPYGWQPKASPSPP